MQLKIVGGTAHAAASAVAPSFAGGRKSSAVTAPPVTSRMRPAMSRPGHAGLSEHRRVTYDGTTPMASAKAVRFIPDPSSHSLSLLIAEQYSAKLKFSQLENVSGAFWRSAVPDSTIGGMAKHATKLRPEPEPELVVTNFKVERPPWRLLRKWRKFRGFTQEQLAGRLDMATASISQLETGKTGYTQDTLERLADRLNCQPADLLMRDPTDPQGIWSIWDRLKPVQQRQAIKVLKALAEEDKAA